MYGIIIITIFLATLIGFLLLYKYLKKSSKFWEKHGIPFWKPYNNLFKNLKHAYVIPNCALQKEMNKKFPENKYWGTFVFSMPGLVIKDPELLKLILTKDFNHFMNHGKNMHIKNEPLSAHLFNLEDDDWKNLRTKLTSTFTTGKMKLMFPLLDECAKQLSDHIMKKYPKNHDDIDIKELAACYGTDVIGSCAFGIQIGALENPNSEFREMGKRFIKEQYKGLVRMLIPNIPQFIVDLLRLHVIDKQVEKYFISIVQQTVQYREQHGVSRNDFLDLLMALRHGTDREEEIEARKIKIDMTPELMAAQCFIFFVAGFETSSSALSFMSLAIAQNLEIQDKLFNEITTVLDGYNNKLTYDALKDLKYMDMVLAETLRKYPPVGALIRECTKDYKLPESNFIIPKGTAVLIPVFGLHYDEKYFPNPEEFRPDNFLDEAKSKRPQYSYIPFGEGPRVCIAERFAKMQVKTAMVYLIKNYKLHLSPRMKVPIEFADNIGLTICKGGAWIQCTPRSFSPSL